MSRGFGVKRIGISSGFRQQQSQRCIKALKSMIMRNIKVWDDTEHKSSYLWFRVFTFLSEELYQSIKECGDYF